MSALRCCLVLATCALAACGEGGHVEDTSAIVASSSAVVLDKAAAKRAAQKRDLAHVSAAPPQAADLHDGVATSAQPAKLVDSSPVARVCGHAIRTCFPKIAQQAARAPLSDVAAVDSNVCITTAEGACRCSAGDDVVACGDGAKRVAIAGPRMTTLLGFGPEGEPLHEVSVGGVCTLYGDLRVHCDQFSFARKYIDIAGGSMHACALDVDDHVECAKTAAYPTLDDNPPSGVFSNIAVGERFACALDTKGFPHCWGNISKGEPFEAPSIELQSLSCGHYHCCGITAGARAHCWGDNTFGQAKRTSGRFAEVAAIDDRTCARTVAGKVSCWGKTKTTSEQAKNARVRLDSLLLLAVDVGDHQSLKPSLDAVLQGHIRAVLSCSKAAPGFASADTHSSASFTITAQGTVVDYAADRLLAEPCVAKRLSKLRFGNQDASVGVALKLVLTIKHKLELAGLDPISPTRACRQCRHK